MPRQVLKVNRSNTLSRRPKQKLRVSRQASSEQPGWLRNIGGWARDRLLLLIGIAGLLWLVVYLVASPDFEITEVSVKGNDLIPTDQLVSLAGLQNQPIMLANTRGAQEAIGKLKTVRAAKVHLEFPRRAVIEVAERPAAYVWKVKETLFLVSEDGIVLGKTSTANQLLALVDLDGKDLTIGDTVDFDALATARGLRSLLPKAIALTPAYFEYSHSEGVVLPTDFAGRVVFGDSNDLDNKVATLKSMKQTIQDQKLVVKFLDLRFQDKPYFR